MRPHAVIHRRCDEHRAAVRKRRLGQDVVRDALRELRERVRRARRNDEQVGVLEVRIGIAIEWPPRQRREGLRGHELLGTARDKRNHVVACLDEEARQIAGLVGRDTAGHTEKNSSHR